MRATALSNRIRTGNYRLLLVATPPIRNLAESSSLSNTHVTRDATAAHQVSRKHKPPRPRGQPQCIRSSFSLLPPEPQRADHSPVCVLLLRICGESPYVKAVLVFAESHTLLTDSNRRG